MVFQSYALWPHMTVRKNVAYPLRGKPGVRKADVAPRVDRALAAVGVSELADQLPDRLSGGQKQRVSLARALVAEVGLILFDEPLSNVDARVRDTLRLEILQTHQRLGFTAIYVTHDQAEAMDLADRVAVLRDGHIEQFDTPDNVYLRPATPYVADFVGTANEIGGVVDAADSATVGIRTSHGQLVTVPAGNASPGWTPQAGSSVKLLWRPEAAEVTVTAVPGEHGRDLARTDKLTLSGQVDLVRFLGGSYELSVRIGPDDHVRGLSSAHQHRPASGDYVEMTVPSGSLRLFPV
jgi:iron(III) transport system ATP-binding protein